MTDAATTDPQLQIIQKLAKVRQEIGTKIGFDAKNPHFKNDYVSLTKTLEVATPALEKQGLMLVQLPSNINGAPALTTEIIDTTTGSAVASQTPLVMDKQTPQAQGACITYLRRYTIHSILGLVGEKDDDAESGMNRSGSGQQRRRSVESQGAQVIDLAP